MWICCKVDFYYCETYKLSVCIICIYLSESELQAKKWDTESEAVTQTVTSLGKGDGLLPQYLLFFNQECLIVIAISL